MSLFALVRFALLLILLILLAPLLVLLAPPALFVAGREDEPDDELSESTFVFDCEMSGRTCAGDRCPGSAGDADLGGAADNSTFIVACGTDLDSVAISQNWMLLDVGGLCASLDGGRIEAFCTPD